MEGHYYSIDVCSSCNERLTRNQKMYSNGTCPYCGNTNNSTIVDTRKEVLMSRQSGRLFKDFLSGLLRDWKRKN